MSSHLQRARLAGMFDALFWLAVIVTVASAGVHPIVLPILLVLAMVGYLRYWRAP